MPSTSPASQPPTPTPSHLCPTPLTLSASWPGFKPLPWPYCLVPLLPFCFVWLNPTCQRCQPLPGVSSSVPDRTNFPLPLGCAYTSISNNNNNMNNATLYGCHDYSSVKASIVILSSDFTRFFPAETTYCLCSLSPLRL